MVLKLLIGIAVVIFTLVSVIVSICKTPDNLKGFYGLMFWIIAIGGFLGGTALIFFAFI